MYLSLGNGIPFLPTDSPMCRSPLWQYRGASLLEELTVYCQLDALPPVQTVMWTFNNTGESVRIGQVGRKRKLKSK